MRKYKLEIEFDSAYELASALAAIEMCVPKDDTYNVADPDTLIAPTTGIWNAFFIGKGKNRPDIMPNSMENQHEQDAWMEVSILLMEAGHNIQTYLARLLKEQNDE